jgi:hypothetical protein
MIDVDLFQRFMSVIGKDNPVSLVFKDMPEELSLCPAVFYDKDLD